MTLEFGFCYPETGTRRCGKHGRKGIKPLESQGPAPGLPNDWTKTGKKTPALVRPKNSNTPFALSPIPQAFDHLRNSCGPAGHMTNQRPVVYDQGTGVIP